MVLVHDDDLAWVCEIFDRNEPFQPEAAMDFLQKLQPKQRIPYVWPRAGSYWLEIGDTKAVTIAMFSKEFEKWAESYISWEGKNESKSLPSPTVQHSDLRASKDGPHQRRSDPDDHKSILFVPSQRTSSLSQPEDAQESSTPFELGERLNMNPIPSAVLLTPSLNDEVQSHDDPYPFNQPITPPFRGASTLGLWELSHPPGILLHYDFKFPPVTPASASPYLGRVAPRQLSHPQPQPSPEPERATPFSEYRGPMVPQKRYKPHTSSDRRRYVDEVVLEGSIHFYMQKPDEAGIPLKDAMHGRFARLVQRDEPMFQERGPSISIRINVGITPHDNFCCATLMDVLTTFHSGLVINPGVAKSLLRISAIPHGLLRAGSSRRT